MWVIAAILLSIVILANTAFSSAPINTHINNNGKIFWITLNTNIVYQSNETKTPKYHWWNGATPIFNLVPKNKIIHDQPLQDWEAIITPQNIIVEELLWIKKYLINVEELILVWLKYIIFKNTNMFNSNLNQIWKNWDEDKPTTTERAKRQLRYPLEILKDSFILKQWVSI